MAILTEKRYKHIDRTGLIYRFMIVRRLFGVKIYQYNFSSNCESDLKEERVKNPIGFKV